METARREGPNLLVSRHNAFPMGLDFRYFWPRIGKQRQVFQANVVGNTEYKEAMHQRVEMEDSKHLQAAGATREECSAPLR